MSPGEHNQPDENHSSYFLLLCSFLCCTHYDQEFFRLITGLLFIACGRFKTWLHIL